MHGRIVHAPRIDYVPIHAAGPAHCHDLRVGIIGGCVDDLNTCRLGEWIIDMPANTFRPRAAIAKSYHFAGASKLYFRLGALRFDDKGCTQ